MVAVDIPLVLQASLLTVLLFAPYPLPLSGPQTRSKKALVEHLRNVHENTIKTHEFSGPYFHLKKCGRWDLQN